MNTPAEAGLAEPTSATEPQTSEQNLPAPMKPKGKRPKALVLISGGADSTLAAKVLLDQGIEVQGISFSTGFCTLDHKRASARPGHDPQKLVNPALEAAADLGIPLEIREAGEEYMDVILNPRHGYGAAANPCIDCRTFMFKKAKDMLEETGADFFATGEVLHQRPMSQNRKAMGIIAEESGAEGLVLRPLSAGRLKATPMEEAGLVDRERLLDIEGRQRVRQVTELNERGIAHAPNASGGCCLLSDRNYKDRFMDLRRSSKTRRLTWNDMMLLKGGRHFRISPTAKVIVGRHEGDNNYFQRYAKGLWTLRMGNESPGPLVLVDGEPHELDLINAARLTARFGPKKRLPGCWVEGSGPDSTEFTRRWWVNPQVNEPHLKSWKL